MIILGISPSPTVFVSALAVDASADDLYAYVVPGIYKGGLGLVRSRSVCVTSPILLLRIFDYQLIRDQK